MGDLSRGRRMKDGTMATRGSKLISLCESCWCMTRTINGCCGKCGAEKGEYIMSEDAVNRELKFRVWSEEDREYRTDCNLKELFTSMAETPFTVYNDEGDRFDIEQYTGLKDKNGKEIYKGDIVDEHNGDVVGKIVQITSGEWRIEWIGIFGGSSSLYSHASLCRVIGNIRENPELLEEKK